MFIFELLTKFIFYIDGSYNLRLKILLIIFILVLFILKSVTNKKYNIFNITN